MAEYIDREALLKNFCGFDLTECVKYGNKTKEQAAKSYDTLMLYEIADVVEDAPAADVAPVVRGRWVDKPTGRYGQMQSWCTACGEHSGIGGIKKNRHKPYCPNCGAKMNDPKGD